VKSLQIPGRWLAAYLLCFATLGAEQVAGEEVWLVEGDYVLTMTEPDPLLRNGAVAIAGDRIVAIDSRTVLVARYPEARRIPGEGRVVMPGLINGHAHSAMTLFRGMVDDLDLMTWLTEYVFPMEGRFVTPEFVRVGTQLACYEMIRGGTTTFVDMYFYPDDIAQVAIDCGLRAVVGAPAIDFPSPGFTGWDDSFAEAVAFVERWKGRHPRIAPAFAPHAPYTVAPAHLALVLAEAQRLDVPITMHLAEAPAETDDVLARYGRRPVAHVAAIGMLDHPLIGAHMVQLNDADIAQLRGKPVGPIHNPTSNMKLGAGIAPVPALLAAGIAVGLGTDGAASNNDLDLWEEIRMAALLHKVASGDPTALPAMDALRLATASGARAIGMASSIGRLAPGLQADLIQVSFSDLQRQPVYDIVSHLVYVLDSQDVVTTIVAGQLLLHEGHVLSIDTAQLRADVERLATLIRAALAVSPGTAERRPLRVFGVDAAQ